jgi:hypothetical protein
MTTRNSYSRLRSHTTQRRAVCSRRSVFEAQEWILDVGMEATRWFDLHKGEQNIHSQELIASWPGEPQDKMIIFTSPGREEVLTIMKMHRSAQQKNAQEWRLKLSHTRVYSQEPNGAQYELCHSEEWQQLSDPSCGNIWIKGVCWRNLTGPLAFL